MLRTVLIIGLLAVPLIGQTVNFSTGAQLVVEDVAVTDKKGNPVEGLKAKDFLVAEDGAPQKIKIFEYENLATQAPAAAEPESFRIYNTLGRMHIAPEAPGSGRYRNRRLLVLYFDMTAMPPADQVRALGAAEKFVRVAKTAADLVAIMRFEGGSVDVLQDFTGDRNRLLSIIETMIVGEGQGFGESTNDASTSDTGAAFGQDDSEFNIFNTDRQLAAIETAAEMLGEISEKKSLIYFGSGLRLNGLDNQAQLQATVNAAIRANVTLWPVDARGLVAQAPLGDATNGSPGNMGMYTGASVLMNTTNVQQSQETLYALAADTGGKALLDENDLTQGITQAQHALSSYYMLGYYSTNTAEDGKCRRIKISLVSQLGCNLDYRHGYYAPKEFRKFTVADKERQLEEALMLPNPITDLTIAMEIDWFQMNRAEYFVPVFVKIPGRELALAKRGGAERTLIDFIGEIKDESGSTVTNVRDKFEIKLSDAAAAELAMRPVEYDTGFTLLPGKYTIKFLARDAETGRIGTYETEFTIPNLNRVKRRIPISSVVLANQQVGLKDALYNASKRKNAETVDPLVRDGEKLVPSVTRVFSRRGAMYVYLQAYEADAATVRPLLAFVSFYRGGRKAFESRMVEVKSGWRNRLKTVPLEITIPLDALTAGAYECQVSVLDPNGERAAFWRAPVMIAQ
jgi:VWFA-related protein